MTIIRRRHNRDYTTIRNDVFRDESLALDALGLLCYLRSRPDDWNISQDQLRRRFGTGSGDARKPMGREQMQRIMRDLIASGWVLREEARTGRGAFGGVEYVVLDEPVGQAPTTAEPPPVASLPQSGFPTAVEGIPESVFPTPGEPSTGEPESAEPESENPTGYQKLDSTKGVSPLNPPVAGGTGSDHGMISEREALAGRRPDPDTARRPGPRPGYRRAALPAASLDTAASTRFERLRAAYPANGRHTVDWHEARAAFGELAPAEQEAAIRDAVAYAGSLARTPGQARRLDRWLFDGLRGGRWCTGELALGGPPGAAPPAPNRVFVRVDTPEWEAWQVHLHATTGKGTPQRDGPGGMGWTFPSLMPPAGEVA